MVFRYRCLCKFKTLRYIYIFDKVLVRGLCQDPLFRREKKVRFSKFFVCFFCLLSFKDKYNKKMKRYKLEVLNTLFSSGKYNE